MKKEMTPEELQAWAINKKQKQHEAWRRWYEKNGKAYAHKRKIQKALAKS